MRLHRLLGIILSGGMGLWCAAPSQAQTEANPAAPPVQSLPSVQSAQLAKPESQITITPTAPGSGRFNIKTEYIHVSALIEELARLSGKKVFISDEVRAQPVLASYEFQDVTPLQMMEILASSIGTAVGIAWGTLGPDTWLVVRRPAIKTATIASAPPVLSVPPAQPAPRFNIPPNGGRYFVYPYPPQPAQPEKMPPGSYGFDFNGQRVYVVPLDK